MSLPIVSTEEMSTGGRSRIRVLVRFLRRMSTRGKTVGFYAAQEMKRNPLHLSRQFPGKKLTGKKARNVTSNWLILMVVLAQIGTVHNASLYKMLSLDLLFFCTFNPLMKFNFKKRCLKLNNIQTSLSMQTFLISKNIIFWYLKFSLGNSRRSRNHPECRRLNMQEREQTWWGGGGGGQG